jgi:hypothetical protein
MMSNMSYCRFESTLADLRDCAEALDEMGGDLGDLSDAEQKAARALIVLCLEIGQGYSPPMNDE